MELENVVLQHFLVMMVYEYAQVTQFKSIQLIMEYLLI